MLKTIPNPVWGRWSVDRSYTYFRVNPKDQASVNERVKVLKKV